MATDEKKLDELTTLMATPGAASGTLPRMVPPGETPEQRAVAEAGAAVGRLVERPEYAEVFRAMVTFRQGYVVAYRRLQELLGDEEAGSLPELTEDLFAGAAMRIAEQPFTEHAVLESMTATVTWLIDTLNRHVQQEVAEAKAEAAEGEKARRARALPIGFAINPAAGDEPLDLELTRARGLILVGWEPALFWIFGQLVTKLIAEPVAHHVIHLLSRPPIAADPRYLPLARNFWEGAANTRDRFQRVLVTELFKQLTAPPDLLLIDDLSLGYTASYTGRPRGATAGDAHKRFARWCTHAGCGLVAGLPLDDLEPPDVRTPEFEQLRSFATVRAVSVVAENETYRLAIGAGSQFVVPAAEIDALKRRRIVGL